MIDVADVQRFVSFRIVQFKQDVYNFGRMQTKAKSRYESLLAINHRMLSCLSPCLCSRRASARWQTNWCQLLLLRFPRSDQALKHN